jgi:hypothetical protein
VRDTAGPIGNDVTVNITNSGGAVGTSVVVDVSYAYSLITPLANILGMFTGGTIDDSFTLSSSADFRLE